MRADQTDQMAGPSENRDAPGVLRDNRPRSNETPGDDLRHAPPRPQVERSGVRQGGTWGQAS